MKNIALGACREINTAPGKTEHCICLEVLNLALPTSFTPLAFWWLLAALAVKRVCSHPRYTELVWAATMVAAPIRLQYFTYLHIYRVIHTKMAVYCENFDEERAERVIKNCSETKVPLLPLLFSKKKTSIRAIRQCFIVKKSSFIHDFPVSSFMRRQYIMYSFQW